MAANYGSLYQTALWNSRLESKKFRKLGLLWPLINFLRARYVNQASAEPL
jgi:hypothetical protein